MPEKLHNARMLRLCKRDTKGTYNLYEKELNAYNSHA